MSQLIGWLILALVFVLNSEYPVEAETQHAILKHDDFPSKCVIKVPNSNPLIINSDQFVRHPEKCAQIYCGRKSYALIYSCEAEYAPKGCVFTDHLNFNAPFPECCPRDLKCNYV